MPVAKLCRAIPGPVDHTANKGINRIGLVMLVELRLPRGLFTLQIPDRQRQFPVRRNEFRSVVD